MNNALHVFDQHTYYIRGSNFKFSFPKLVDIHIDGDWISADTVECSVQSNLIAILC